MLMTQWGQQIDAEDTRVEFEIHEDWDCLVRGIPTAGMGYSATAAASATTATSSITATSADAPHREKRPRIGMLSLGVMLLISLVCYGDGVG